MRIIVASAHVPFVRGGGTQIVDDVRVALREAGHTVDIVTIPVWESPAELPAQLLAMRLFDVASSGDRLIAIRTPSHLLRHPVKVIWFLHHHRAAYDLWDSPFGDIPNDEEGRRVRDLIKRSDDVALREAHSLFANSETTRDRLKTFNDLEAEVLLPPLPNPGHYYCAEADGYVFFPSRITPAKRQVLAVQAMAHVRTRTRLVIAGPADTPEALDRLHRAIDDSGVSDRVTLMPRWISEKEKHDLFARSLGCVFIPFDEDSYGYVALEAYHARKPVVTCSDSGGVLSLVEGGITGLVSDPTPEALGAAIDRLAQNSRVATQMGQAGFAHITTLGITWERVVGALTR